MTTAAPARRHPIASPRALPLLALPALVLLAVLPAGHALAATTATTYQAPPSPPNAIAPASPATSADSAEPAPPPAPPRFRFGVELDTNFRHSSDYYFYTHYPPLPGFTQETVDPGSHFEVSMVSLRADYQPSPLLEAHLLFNGVNLYYRNPTSTDHPYDLAELWVRYGRDTPVAAQPARPGAYLKLGKFDRPERNVDRPLVSYGLLDTAFNLFQDVGLEAGADLGPHFFAKAAFTEGNPLFVRDPGALAGDTPDLLTGTPGADLNSGLTILYDSHVETLDWSHPETAAYLGWRMGDTAGANGMELLLWGRRRTLAVSADLPGSPLGGDLAALTGPNGVPILPIHGDQKEEIGANFWAFQGDGLQVFAQYVYQRVAGLERAGLEVEGARRFELPLVLAAGGHQLFSWIAPALRYSRLHDAFPNAPTPEPTLAWDWEKYDGGIRLGLWHDIDLTLEYSYNRIFLTPQIVESVNEALATLRIRVDH